MSLSVALNYVKEAGPVLQSKALHDLIGGVGAGKSGEAALAGIMNNHDTAISALAKAVFLFAMSPFITYGVGPETVVVGLKGDHSGSSGWDSSTIALLEDLAERRLTGNNAREAVVGELQRLDMPSRILLYRVLVKEMRMGLGPKTVNKFHKGLVPIFEHKGAKRTKEALHKMSWPCWAEYKIDGWRGVIKTDGKTVESFSRNGLPMPNLDYRAQDLKVLTLDLIQRGVLAPGFWAWDGEGKAEGHFNATSSEARKAGKGAELVYHVFDLIPWEHMAGGDEPIEVRHARLDQVQWRLNELSVGPLGLDLPDIRVIERFELDEEADAWELYRQALALGHEGLILKRKGSRYIPGKNDDWVKVKPAETKDLLITGTFPGEKGSKYESMIGGVIVDHAGVAVRVGSGITDEDRGRDPSYFINKIAEIEYHEETPDGSLREPRLKGLRADKHPEDADGAGS